MVALTLELEAYAFGSAPELIIALREKDKEIKNSFYIPVEVPEIVEDLD